MLSPHFLLKNNRLKKVFFFGNNRQLRYYLFLVVAPRTIVGNLTKVAICPRDIPLKLHKLKDNGLTLRDDLACQLRSQPEAEGKPFSVFGPGFELHPPLCCKPVTMLLTARKLNKY